MLYCTESRPQMHLSKNWPTNRRNLLEKHSDNGFIQHYLPKGIFAISSFCVPNNKTLFERLGYRFHLYDQNRKKTLKYYD